MIQLTLMTIPDVVTKIDIDLPEKRLINLASEFLKSGKLVVAPSDTRYALLARADSEAAIQRMFSSKKRSKNHPVSIFVESVEQMAKFVSVTENARILAKTFLPGPLTLILSNKDDSQYLHESLVKEDKIGVRISSSRVIYSLLNSVGVPLTATSANLSGKGDLETIDQIYHDFGDEVSMYLDGGTLSQATSTVVDCTDKSVRIIRQGAIKNTLIFSALQSGGASDAL